MSLMSLNMLLAFVFGFSSWICNVECTTYCNEEDECAGKTVSDDYVFCNGYQGCWTADVDCSDDCYCFGYQGCYGADVYSEGTTSCDGSFGCARAELDVASNLYCDGEWGCYANTITSSDITYCNGDYGCYSSDISGTNRVDNGGYYSGRLSTIDTQGIDTFTLFQRGHYSGLWLDLTCQENSTCNVYCSSNTGCYGLDIYCYGDCSYTCGDCQTCPTLYDYSSLDISDKIKQEWDEYKHEKQLLKSQLKNEFDQIMEDNKKENGDVLPLKELIQNFDKRANVKFNNLRVKYNKPQLEEMDLFDRDDIGEDAKLEKLDQKKLSTNKVVTLSNNNKNTFYEFNNKTIIGAMISGAILFGVSIVLNIYFVFVSNNCNNSDNKYQPILG